MGAKEACGVFGAHSSRGADVVPKMLKGLEALQHRGQESWGIAVAGKPVFKRMGLAFNWVNFSRELIGYKGSSGIGHIRYSTKGRSNLGNAQPVQVGNEFSIAHNGTIVNTEELQKTVRTARTGADCSTDTKVVGHRLLQILKEENDWFYAFERLAKEVVGAYSFTVLNKQGEVFAIRDPRGYRPLCIGKHERSGTYIAASESCALTAVEAEFIRDVEPGEMIRLGGKKGFEAFRFSPKVSPAHCSFEYTYFAHPSSVINGVNVYEARKKVGRILARKKRMKGKVVIPVPDSARPAALGYSLESGIPMDEGLMKDRYRRKGSMRSFIEPKQGGREEVVKRIIPIKETIEGRDVIVIDDSVVRGTSSKIIVDSLKNAGAKSIKMAITFPPIMHPCYMGVDFPSREELVAYRVAPDDKDLATIGAKVAKSIGADELYYNDIDGLAEAIGLPKDSLCFACINGDYSKLNPANSSSKEKT